jgi:hypothetical protein
MVIITDIDVILHPSLIIRLLFIPQKLDPRVTSINLNIFIVTSTTMNVGEIWIENGNRNGNANVDASVVISGVVGS